MANFVTADDKRIKDLPQETNPDTGLFFAVDKPGFYSAKKISATQLINLLSGSGSKQDANAGTTNPDNTSGNVGDFYYKIPADGSSLTMFKKVSSNSWATVFNLPIGGGTSDDFKRVFKVLASGIDASGSVNLTDHTNEQGDNLIPSDANVDVYQGGKTIPATFYENGIVEGLEPSLDVKVVLRGSEPAPFESNLLIDNNSSQTVDYTIGSGSGNITPGDEVSGLTPPGLSISVTLINGQSCVYTVYNSDGSVYFTSTQSGPTTINGLPTTETTRQEYIVTDVPGLTIINNSPNHPITWTKNGQYVGGPTIEANSQGSFNNFSLGDTLEFQFTGVSSLPINVNGNNFPSGIGQYTINDLSNITVSEVPG